MRTRLLYVSASSGKRYAPLIRWWLEGSQRQGLEVLHDGGEVKLIACPGEAAQPHALEAMVGLEVRKSHLYLLALIA